MDIIKKYLVILLTLMAINSQAKVSANIDGTEPCPEPTEFRKDTTICEDQLPYTWYFGLVFEIDGHVHSGRILTADGQCDSIRYHLKLHTKDCTKPETCLDGMVYAKWTNFLFCDNGKDQFTHFQWYQDDQLLQGETKQYLYRKSGLGTSNYFVEVTRADGSKEKTCPVTFSEAPKSVDSYGNSSHAPMRRVSVPIGTVVLHVDIDEDGNTYKTIQLR